MMDENRFNGRNTVSKSDGEVGHRFTLRQLLWVRFLLVAACYNNNVIHKKAITGNNHHK